MMCGDLLQQPVWPLLIQPVERDRAFDAVKVGARRSDVQGSALPAYSLDHLGRVLLLDEQRRGDLLRFALLAERPTVDGEPDVVVAFGHFAGSHKSQHDPRGVLRDFGFELPEDTKIRIWDSTAEIRYLVLPMRPLGTDGWSEQRLADLVTRDSMIGTGLPKEPDEIA